MAIHSASDRRQMREGFRSSKPKETRQGRYEGTQYITGEQLNARDEQRRKKELAAQKNKAAKSLAETQNKGTLDVAKTRQKGVSARAGLDRAQQAKQFQENLGLQNRQLKMKRNKGLMDRLSALTTNQVDDLGNVIRPGLSRGEALKRLVAEQEAIKTNFGDSFNQGVANAGQRSSLDRIVKLQDGSYTNTTGAASTPEASKPLFEMNPRERGRGSFTRVSGRESVSKGLERRPVNFELRKFWNLPI